MTSTHRDQGGCINEAVLFVAAQPGGAQRLLDTHLPRPDGSCRCSTHSLTPWPCVVVTIARAAAAHHTSEDG